MITCDCEIRSRSSNLAWIARPGASYNYATFERLFNRGDTEGTNSMNILYSMFVYVLFYVNLCQDWFCGLWIICGLLTYVQSK